MSGARMGRRLARLRAVQALYQMDIAATPLSHIMDNFLSDNRVTPSDIDGKDIVLPAADARHFELLLRGVIAEQAHIDSCIEAALRKDWRLARLDSTLRAILRCGAYEVLHDDAPMRMVCSEYTTLAHGFFDNVEGGVVNALLQKLAQDKPVASESEAE